MQPTDVQVERTLAALRVEQAPHRGVIPRDTLDLMLQELPDGLLEDLENTPEVRSDRLQAVRDRLEHGDELSNDELASRIVGRLVCDRLR